MLTVTRQTEVALFYCAFSSVFASDHVFLHLASDSVKAYLEFFGDLLLGTEKMVVAHGSAMRVKCPFIFDKSVQAQVKHYTKLL